MALLAEAGIINEAPRDRDKKRKWFAQARGNENFKLLCSLLDRAELELASQRLHSLNNGTFLYSEDKFFTTSNPQTLLQNTVNTAPSASSSTVNAKTVAELSSEFLAFKKEEVTSSRYNQFQIPVRVISEIFGSDTPINEINVEHVMEMKDFLPDIPAHVSKKYPNMTVREAAKKHAEETGEKANRYDEAKKTLSAIGQIFKFSKQRKMQGACNPVEDLQIDVPKAFKKKNFERKQDGYSPYSVEDLSKIFSSIVYSVKGSTNAANKLLSNCKQSLAE